MMQKEQLVDLLEQADKAAFNAINVSFEEYYSQFADHLLSHGVIVPPCKIGTILYNIVDEVEEIHAVDGVEEICVFGFNIDKDDSYLMVERWCENLNEMMSTNDYWLINFNDLGKTVFPTREEAEQALKERDEK